MVLDKTFLQRQVPDWPVTYVRNDTQHPTSNEPMEFRLFCVPGLVTFVTTLGVRILGDNIS